jgi:hypothetical protein
MTGCSQSRVRIVTPWAQLFKIGSSGALVHRATSSQTPPDESVRAQIRSLVPGNPIKPTNPGAAGCTDR